MNLDSGGGSGEEEEDEGEEEEDSHSEEFQTGNACGREQRQCRVAEVGESSYEGEREGENATVRRKLRSRERATQKTGREIQGANGEAQRKKKKKKRKYNHHSVLVLYFTVCFHFCIFAESHERIKDMISGKKQF